jgi:hypothetical protein
MWNVSMGDEYVRNDIEYLGMTGATRPCVDGVVAVLHSNVVLERAWILTHFSNDDFRSPSHGLLLQHDDGDLIAIKAGFSSGYGGEAPTGFSQVIQLLTLHGVPITEVEVDDDFMNHLDEASLTSTDIANLESKRASSRRVYDYVIERDRGWRSEELAWRTFSPVIPFAAVPPSLIDLAVNFWADPDQRLLTGYRRLEDRIRERCASKLHGQKLMSLAFRGDNAALLWDQLDPGEREGRASLFVGAFQAFRNRRAHRICRDSKSELLQELMLLCLLFSWESEAVENSTKGAEQSGHRS